MRISRFFGWAPVVVVLGVGCQAPSPTQIDPGGVSDDGGAETTDGGGSTGTGDGDAGESGFASDSDGADGSTSAGSDTDGGSGGEAPPPGAPVALFTDLTSGPNHGWRGDDGRGVAVTVFGRNFGGTRGDSFVTIGGVALDDEADYLQWGAPGRLPGVESITVLIPADVPMGDTELAVTVGGERSSALPFVVREGGLFYVETTGSGAGDGSWGSPWAQLQQAIDAMGPGDIAYVGDGVAVTVEGEYSAAINLSKHGEPGRPIAMVAMPGATVNVGGPAINRGLWYWVADDGSYADHWTIAGFEVACGETCIPLGHGSRAVNNRVTAPEGTGQSGAIHAGEGNATIVGNEVTGVGAQSCSKLYHAIYVTGPRTNTPPRLDPVGEYEVAWNYIHDNRTNRGINFYSEQDFSAFVRDSIVHDNLIMDQRGDGILIGWYVTGDTAVYNNIVVRAGLGPEWVDGISSHAGIRIGAGHAEERTNLSVAHNTVVDAGFGGAEFELSGGLLVDSDLAAITVVGNVFSGSSEPALAGESLALPADDWGNLWFPVAPAWDSAAVEAAPTFVSVDALDLHPTPDSALVDAIDAAPEPRWARDYDGVARPQGEGSDLGALEAVVDGVAR